jgi:hypothetical protein
VSTVQPDGYAVLLDDAQSAPEGFWFVGCYTKPDIAMQTAAKNNGRMVPIYFAAPSSTVQPFRVPFGWRLIKDAAPDERNWTEDASHENGSYHCLCISCGRGFVGHKRRCICKACSEVAVVCGGETLPATLSAIAPISYLIEKHHLNVTWDYAHGIWNVGGGPGVMVFAHNRELATAVRECVEKMAATESGAKNG